MRDFGLTRSTKTGSLPNSAVVCGPQRAGAPQRRGSTGDAELGYRQFENTMKKKKKRKPVHSGEILCEDFMKPYRLSMNKLALHLRVPVTRIADIVVERRGRNEPPVELKLFERNAGRR
jgi:hypothetical protein